MSTKTSTIPFRKNVLGKIGFMLLAGSVIISGPNSVLAQGWQWANTGAGNTVASSCSKPAVDQSENVYLTGSFRSGSESMKFSNSTVALNSFNPDVFTIFMTKYNKEGNLLWAKSFKSGLTNGEMITVDPTGNIYCTGMYMDSIKIEQTMLTGSSGEQKQFLAKFKPDGVLVWAKNITSASNGHYMQYQDIKLDAQGRILLTGTFNQTNILFDNISLNNSNNAGTSYDVFLVKYDADGNAIWGKAEGTPARHDRPSVLSINAAGGFYLGGSYVDTGVVIYGSQLKLNKYDPAGNLIWTQAGTSNTGALLGDITSDHNGNLYATGSYSSPFQFGNSTLNEIGGGCFTLKCNPAGTVVWARSSKSSETDISTFTSGIGVDEEGTVSINGFYVYSLLSPVTSISFDTITLTLQGPRDAFFTRYDKDGKLISVHNIAGQNSEYSSGLTVLPNGNAYYTGSFYSPTITLDQLTLSNPPDAAGNHYGKFFVAKYSGKKTTGIDHVNNDIAVDLYPNPTHGIINITASEGIVLLNITDQLGRQLFSKQFSDVTRQCEVDISNLSKGQYCISIYTTQGYAAKKITLN